MQEKQPNITRREQIRICWNLQYIVKDSVFFINILCFWYEFRIEKTKKLIKTWHKRHIRIKTPILFIRCNMQKIRILKSKAKNKFFFAISLLIVFL